MKSSPRILHLIDDDAEDLSFFNKFFERHGIESYLFKTTDEFLSNCRAKSGYTNLPDVLLIDYRINDNGEACLSLLNRFKNTQLIPIMMVVTGAYGDLEMMRKCYAAGATDVRPKDDPTNLINRINKIWNESTTTIIMNAKHG